MNKLIKINFRMVLFLIALLTSSLFSGPLKAQSGIEFKEYSWSEALSQARAMNKPIFIDLFTTWCGPCKRMEKEIFTLNDVGMKYNDEFINLKVDAEKGEGLDIQKKFKVEAFPTYLFIDGSGELVYKVIGFKFRKEFLKEADMALSEFSDVKRLPVWDIEFADNQNNQGFLHDYIQKRNKLLIDNQLLLDNYFAMLDDNSAILPDNLELIAKTLSIVPNGFVFKLLAKNFETIKATSTPTTLAALHSKMHEGLVRMQMRAVTDKNDSILENVIIPGYKILPETTSSPWLSKSNGDEHKMFHYRQTDQFTKFMHVAPQYLNTVLLISLARMREKDKEIIESVSVGIPASEDSKKGFREMMLLQFKEYYSDQCYNELVNAAEFVLKNNASVVELKEAEKWARKAVDIRSDEQSQKVLSEISTRLNQNER